MPRVNNSPIALAAKKYCTDREKVAVKGRTKAYPKGRWLKDDKTAYCRKKRPYVKLTSQQKEKLRYARLTRKLKKPPGSLSYRVLAPRMRYHGKPHMLAKYLATVAPVAPIAPVAPVATVAPNEYPPYSMPSPPMKMVTRAQSKAAATPRRSKRFASMPIRYAN